MTPDAYLDRVRALLPAIRERVSYTEELRRLPDETFKEFQEAGLFRALQPKRYEGYELDPGTFYQAVIEVGTVCGSSAWVLGVVGVHNWQLALFPPQAQEDVWGEDTSIQLSTSLSPTGTVERVRGGFWVRGRWSFSSGCDFCQWVLLAGVVPSPHDDAPPQRLIVLLPRSDYEIDDNWDVIGLSGSGSKDIVVQDAFVPEYRVFSTQEAFELRSPGLAVHDAPLYRLSFGNVFSYGISSPTIGVALGALNVFREQAKSRLRARDQSRVATDPFVQLHLAEAAAEVDAARDRMLHNFATMMDLARAGQEIPLAQRARCRWDAANAVTWSAKAVDRLFKASGGRAIFRHNPIQRAWRDVHAMQAHAGNNAEKMSAIYSRSALGLPPEDMSF